MGVIWALCGLVRKGNRRTKRGFGIIPCILDWVWLGELYLRKNMYMTLEREEESMEIKRTFIMAMENG